MGILEQLKQWDEQLFLYLNGFHNTFMDYVMTVFTSEAIWVPFYMVTMIIIGKRYGRKSVLIFLTLGILITCSDQFAGVLKHSLQRLRPSHDPELSQLTHIFYHKGGLYGFVSAHASNAFAYATFTILLFRNNLYTIFIIPWAMLIAYTRIYLGLHYPGDILFGALLGIALSIGLFRLMLYLEAKLSSVNKISKNALSYRQTVIIMISGLSLMLITMLIINLLLNKELVIN